MGSFKFDFHWSGPDVGQSVYLSVGGHGLPSTVYQLTTDKRIQPATAQEMEFWTSISRGAGIAQLV